MTIETPACADCRHHHVTAFRGKPEIEMCLRFRMRLAPGSADPKEKRVEGGACGPSGRFYEPKGDPQ